MAITLNLLLILSITILLADNAILKEERCDRGDGSQCSTIDGKMNIDSWLAEKKLSNLGIKIKQLQLTLNDLLQSDVQEIRYV